MRNLSEENLRLSAEVHRISANSSPSNSPTKNTNSKTLENIQQKLVKEKSKIEKIMELFESCTQEELIEFNELCNKEDEKKLEDDEMNEMDLGNYNLELPEAEPKQVNGKIRYDYIIRLNGIGLFELPEDIVKKIQYYKKETSLKVENSFRDGKSGAYCILTNDEATYTALSGDWTPESGISIYENRPKDKIRHQNPKAQKEKKFFIAIRGIETHRKIESDSFEDNGVVEATRILKKSTGNPLSLIKARAKDEASYRRLLAYGLKIGWTSYRVTAWLTDAGRPLQCYKCLKFGHHQSECKEVKQVCLKCGDEHSYKECKIEQDKLKCSNCKGNHAAVSKCCETAKLASIKKTTEQFDKAISKFNPARSFANVVSSSSENMSVNDIILSLFGEIFKLIETPKKDKLAKIAESLLTLLKQSNNE